MPTKKSSKTWIKLSPYTKKRFPADRLKPFTWLIGVGQSIYRSILIRDSRFLCIFATIEECFQPLMKKISAHTMRTAAMPFGMAVGALLCRPISQFDEWSAGMLTPVLIFLMLFFTFCRVDVRRMRPNRMHLWLLLAQMAGSVAVYFALLPLGQTLAQGAMVCVLAPIAMAAVVIGGMLDAKVETMAAYSLVCNLATAALAPAILSLAGSGTCSFGAILTRVAPLLVAPFAAGQFCRYVTPKVSAWVADHSRISFYIWLVSLAVVIGRTTAFILDHSTDSGIEMALAGAALVICVAQFALGRYIGGRYGDRIAGGQSLGQKNTVMAIWMAQSFLDPLSCIAPAAHIIWQNIVNSWQIYRKK